MWWTWRIKQKFENKKHWLNKEHLLQPIPIASCVVILLLIIAFYTSILNKGRIHALKALTNRPLVILTTTSPTTQYHNYKNNLTGFEYDLISAFSKHYGFKVKFKSFKNEKLLLKALNKGEGDIAAAHLPLDYNNKNSFLLGPKYGEMTYKLICHEAVTPQSLDDLDKLSIQVIQNSTEEDLLKRIKKKFLPQLSWYSLSYPRREELLRATNQRTTDCTVTDSFVADYYLRIFTQLKDSLTLSESKEISWFIHPNAVLLQKLVHRWFQHAHQSGFITRIHERYFGHLENFNQIEAKYFIKRSKSILPAYKNLFKKAAEQYKLPWKLIAAISYQESHWNPNAVSFTGVKGMMMLTQNTAQFLGVKNRLSPKESIFGGAKYLSFLLTKVPKDIPQHERIWYALAAYNVGLGHVQDAKKLALLLDKSPNYWFDLKQVLPLLTQKEYYQKTKHGYARGQEPVSYVDRIRNYYEVLKKL